MIRNAAELAEVRKNWEGVEALRERIQRSAFASMGVIGGSFPVALVNAAHNLPFFHACGVLERALWVLAHEGHFRCKSKYLGPLLEASEHTLPWQDYALIKTGVDRRNGVAHHGQLLDRGECWKYVDAIKAELQSWRIV